MYITETARDRLTDTWVKVQKAGKVAWLIAAGIVALIVITLVLATNYFAAEKVFARSNGDELSNATQLLESAELAHNASLTAFEKVEVLSPLGEADTLCYLVLVGETLTDDIACGVVRFASNEFGGYDITKATYTANDGGGVVGSLPETVTWERAGSLPAGATLVRPDGKQALPGDLLKRPVVEAQPLPVTETVYVEVDHFLPGETITEYITETVEVLVPASEPVTVESAALLATVEDEKGEVFTAPEGENLLALEVTGIVVSSPAEWFLEVDEERTPLELDELGQAIVRIPAGATVLLVSVLDGVEQSILLTGEFAGVIDMPAELEPLYSAEPPVWSQDASRFSAKETTKAEVSGQVSITSEVWDEQLGWGITKVAVSSLDNFCRADDQGSRIYSKSTAVSPYDFSSASLSVDGTKLGAPESVSSGADGVYVLAWRTGQASEVSFDPTVTLTCEGTFWGSGGQQAFETYDWTAPVELTGSITAVLEGGTEEETGESESGSSPSPSPSATRPPSTTPSDSESR